MADAATRPDRTDTTTGLALREQIRSTLARLSRTGELPALPAAAMTALAIARQDAGVEDVCRVIRSDVALSACVLRAANSAAYARRVPARSLTEAVLTLGLRKTSDLLLAAGARRFFAQVPRHAEALWNHAVATGLLAEEIVRETSALAPHVAFLPALFHDIGRIAFLLTDAEAFDTVHGRLHAGGVTTPDVERAWYGFDHAEAGAILAEDWGLAPEQVEGIRWHHEPMQSETGRVLAAVIAVADASVYAVGLGGGAVPPSDACGREALGISIEATAAALARARSAFEEQRELLGG